MQEIPSFRVVWRSYETPFFLEASGLGIAAIAERRKLFTASADRKTAATSGSSTMATVPSL